MKPPPARSADAPRCQWVRLIIVSFIGVWLTGCDAGKPNSEEAVVRGFLENYFATWSKQDMEGYGRCFHETARVTYVDGNGESHTDGLSDFLFGQKMGHQTSPEPMTEVPESMLIQLHHPVAQAQVRWKLTKGKTIVTGTDFFTLIKSTDSNSKTANWKIINLVFHND